MKKSIKEIELNDFSTIQATINVYLYFVIQWRDALRASGLAGAVAEGLTPTQKAGQGDLGFYAQYLLAKNQIPLCSSPSTLHVGIPGLMVACE